MNILSIFIDESGDFGEYNMHSPYYIVSMVFHNQNNKLGANITLFENKLSQLGFPNHCIHSGPIIRGEEEYKSLNIEIRKSILRNTATFIKNVDIQYKSFYIEKKHIKNELEIIDKLSKQISNYLKELIIYFQSYDQIVLYYDNGQIQLNRILISVFNSLYSNVEFRRVKPSEYKLFQVADFICTMKMIELKYKNKVASKSESYFFKNEKVFKKQYLNILIRKEMN